jgi:hypothetical protein
MTQMTIVLDAFNVLNRANSTGGEDHEARYKNTWN